VRKVYPASEFKWLEKTLVLKWPEALELLRTTGGAEVGDYDDLK